MNIQKSFFYGVLLAILLVFSACAANNSEGTATNTPGTDVNSTVPDDNTIFLPSASGLTVVLPVSASVLKVNKQVVTINVRVFDADLNFYSTGVIKKKNPIDILTRDIGTFVTNEAPLVDGVATFVYTAPDDLDANTSNITFGFYHESNASDIRTYTMSIVPEVNQTVLTSYVLKSSNPTDVNMNLESVKSVSYAVYDASETLVQDADMVSMTVTSLNPSLAILRDTYSNEGNTLSITGQNNFSINLVSNTKSGLVPIKVNTTFLDANSNEQNLTEVFNIVILSGPPTAASLGYVGSSFDNTKGLYTEKWRLMATDAYSNLVNTNPSVSTSMLVGYAQSSGTTLNAANYLYFDPVPGGSLSANGTKGQFTAPTAVFDDIDLSNDKLVLFGTGYKFNAFGKWEIDTTSSSVLNLSDDFNVSTISGLGFAVGHNLRNETCSGDSVVADVAAADGNITLSDDGILLLDVVFSDYMVGKSVVLSTNFVGGYNNITGQLGYAKKITLVGTGLTASTYIVKKGTSFGVKRLPVYVNDSPHGATYKNANFAYDVEVSAQDTNVTVVGDSNNQITSCTVGGNSYVDVNITAPAGGDGEIKLTNLRISNEF